MLDQALPEGEKIRELLKSFYLDNTNINDVELEKNKLKAHELIEIMGHNVPTNEKKAEFEVRKKYIDATHTGGTIEADDLAKDLV